MPRTKREKTLMLAVAILLALGLGYTQLERTGLFSGFGKTGSELEQLRAEYKAFREILELKKGIERDWKAIGQAEQRPEGLTPEMHFSRTIHEMCQALQLPTPQDEPCQIKAIPEVQEYGLIYIKFLLRGPWERIAQLLKQLDARGYLIDELLLSHQKDQSEVQAAIIAAQPVKLADVSAARPGG